jgi:hypothetical protein
MTRRGDQVLSAVSGSVGEVTNLCLDGRVGKAVSPFPPQIHGVGVEHKTWATVAHEHLSPDGGDGMAPLPLKWNTGVRQLDA